MYSEGFDADSANRGDGADDEFATLVLDERFVKAALIHEPSAFERQTALRGKEGFGSAYPPRVPGRSRLRRRSGRGRYQAAPNGWQRTVIQMMLLVLGVLALMVAAAAVYRGAGTEKSPSQVPSRAATTAATAASAHS